MSQTSTRGPINGHEARTGEIKNTFQRGKVELGKQVSLACHI